MDDLTGGTFTITNAGNIGGLFATPIINFPEVGILGVHAIKDTPVVRNGAIVVGKVMYLSVSIDHRIVDGATGARWMNVVKEHLEQPWRLLLA
jgi:pyruvate dehydrogenase E2 component (dihydrolipoamide acetyltransferase)